MKSVSDESEQKSAAQVHIPDDPEQKSEGRSYNIDVQIDSNSKYHLLKYPLKKLAKAGVPKKLQWEYWMCIPDTDNPGHYIKRGMVRLGTRNESEARRKAAQWLQGKENEAKAEAKRLLTLAADNSNIRLFFLDRVWDHSSDYALDCIARGKSLSTSYIIAARSKLIRYFFPWCRTNKIELLPQLGKAELRRWRNWMFAEMQKKEMTASNVNLTRAHIQVALKWAESMDLIPSNPMSSVEPVKENRKEREMYTKEEIGKLLEAQGDLRAQVAVRLMGTTGARLGEVIGLRWKNVHLDESYIDIVEQFHEAYGVGYTLPKSKKPRKDVHLSGEMVEDLRALKKKYPFGQVVFQDSKGPSKPIRRYELRTALKALAEKAGVELDGRLNHSFRHSWASMMAEARGLEEVSKLIGHSGTKITAGYVHETEASRQANNRAIDGMFQKAVGK